MITDRNIWNHKTVHDDDHHHHQQQHHCADSMGFSYSLVPTLCIHPNHPSRLESLLNFFRCLHKADVINFLLVRPWYVPLVRPCVVIHRRTLLMNSSLLLPKSLGCLVRLAWMVFERGSKLPYSCYFVGLLVPFFFQNSA